MKSAKKYKQPVLKLPVNQALLDDITQRIVKKINPHKIILFGSFAYGKPNQDSDLDLFIIKETKLPFGKRFGMVSDALYPRVIPMDFIVKTPKEINERLKKIDPFIEEVLEKGKVLYENKRNS